MSSPEDRDLESRIGPLEINWPRTVGYYGGIVLAVSAGVIEPPLGIFIAAVPLMKLLNRPNSSLPARVVSQLLDGAAKPVGGDNPAVIQVGQGNTPSRSLPGGGILSRVGREAGSIWAEAKTVARGA